MKLARKLVVALIAAIVVVMSASAFLRVQIVLGLFDGQVEGDHRVFGGALAGLVADVAEHEGVARARALVAGASSRIAVADATSIRWVAETADFDRPGVLREPFEMLARDGGTWLENDGGVDRRVTMVPVRGGAPTALEIVQSIGRRREYVRTSFLSTAVTTVVIAGVCGALAAAIGLVMVGRPVGRLVKHARRIGEGDFHARLDLDQDDEIGLLATEMNAMATALERAQSRVVAESEQRIRALEQLRQADRLLTVGRLASGIAHELGTPLNVVGGRALQIAMKETTPEETVKYAEQIVESSDRMTAIIRQLLDFARKWEPERARQDVRRLVRQTLALLSSLSQRAGIDLFFDEPSGPVEARIDASQIQQVLTNVVVNALHASPSGSTVRIELSTTEKPQPPPGITLAARRYVALAVVDRGTGIAAENLGAIFEPFFTTKDVGEGTGLGLSVSWGIVREHEGWIEVKSEVGKGSTFTIFLPEGE